MKGSYNLVYCLIFSDGVKWIARIPENDLSEFGPLQRRRMISSIRTTALIRSATSIPIPEIFAWETITDTIGVPYTLEAFVEGSLLAERWTDRSWTTEDKRLKVLRNLAAVMSELNKLQFSKIGALYFSEDGNFSHVGEMVEVERDITDEEENWGRASTRGPFDTVESWLTRNWEDLAEERAEWRKAELAILRLAVESIPSSLSLNGHFALGHPDFNYQNIFVGDDGEITGIVDWDNVRMQPRSLGFARYPSWITRDWDPVMYGYDVPGSREEDSPEALLRYRQEYATAFAKLQLPESAYFKQDTELSHLIEAIDIAVGDAICRSGIVQKLLTHAFKSHVPFDLPQFLKGYKDGDSDIWIPAIRKAFREMWHREWTQEESGMGDGNYFETGFW